MHEQIYSMVRWPVLFTNMKQKDDIRLEPCFLYFIVLLHFFFHYSLVSNFSQILTATLDKWLLMSETERKDNDSARRGREKI